MSATNKSDKGQSTQEVPSSSGNPYSITEKILEERLRKPHYGHVCRQLFAGTLACLSSLSFGTTLGWAHSITHDIEKQKEEIQDLSLVWLVSIALLGSTFGVALCAFLMKQMGPKRVLQTIGPLYILNWWLILIPSVDTQLAGRFFLGFLGIAYSTSGENLLLQTVHYGIRRYITVFHGSTMILGVLVSRVVGTATTKFWITFLCAAIPIVHYVFIQIVPESPVFLYATSHAAAAKSLTWYRGAGNFYMDMANIKRDWDAARQDSDAYQYMLFSRVVYRALLVVIGVTFIQVWSGYFIFMFFGMVLWAEGRIVISPLTDSTIIAICFVCTKLLWGYLHTVHTWKVRGFLISSCFLTSLCLFMMATYLLLLRFEVKKVMDECNWLPMMIVCLFLFFCDMGLNYFPKILIFEYMPFQMYKKANFLVQAAFWLFTFLNAYFYTFTFVYFPNYGVFSVLAALTFLGTLFCYFFVVEPKGKSLIQIQMQFGGNPIGTRGALFNQTRQML